MLLQWLSSSIIILSGTLSTFEKEYTGLGAAFGFVQTLVAPGTSSLLSFNNSAEYEGLAGIMGDRQHTLQNCHKIL